MGGGYPTLRTVGPVRGFEPRRIAQLILGLYLVLGVGYSVLNPLFESTDEVGHYPYVKYLADDYGLPVQDSGQETLWEQEGSQPPLYYALAAALTFWIDTDDLATVRRLNPHARVGIPLAQDNKNMVIHSDREKLPWEGTVLAMHLVRLFSVLLGAGTVWCTYRLALSVFPRQPVVALGAMSLNALNPMFLFISGSVNNDNLVIFLASLALLLLVDAVKTEGANSRFAMLGVVIGLACLSKLSALGLIPLAFFALALRRFRGISKVSGSGLQPAATTFEARSFWREIRPWTWECIQVLAPAAVLAGWWYARNLRLYGDPTGLNAMLEVFGSRSKTPSLLELLGEFQGLRISFWGLFGVVNVLFRPHWLYRVLDALTLGALIGLIRVAVQAWRKREFSAWPVLLLLATWPALVGLSLIRWTTMTKASQGRLIFPAISPICLLFALGLLVWFPKRHWSRVVGVLAVLLGLLALSAPFTAILPAYARPSALTVEDLPESAYPFNTTYGNGVELLAYEIDNRTVHPGDSLGVTLYWRALAPMDEDYSIYIHLFGWQAQKLGQRDSYPGGGNYPTSQWSSGAIFADRYLVFVSEDALGPVAAELEVGLYRLATMEKLPILDGRRHPVDRAILTRIKVSVPTPPAAPQYALDDNLDQRARLVGFGLGAQEIEPGGTVPITLYWQVIGEFEQDYHVFVHLVDESETLIGQGDGPPLEGAYPTSFWGVGEAFTDTHDLRVADDALPGAGRIYVGLYDLSTGRRLPVVDQENGAARDRVLLTAITVSEGR